MESISYSLFIKLGERVFMEKLINDGEVFCKPFNYFREKETASLRNDIHEGAIGIQQIQDLRLFRPQTNELIGFAEKGQFFGFGHKEPGNMYCLYGIEKDTLDLKDDTIKPFHFDLDSLNWGDTAVVIYNPGQFHERFLRATAARNFELKYHNVVYYDETQYKGELSPFHKSDRYKQQKEFRYLIQKNGKDDLTFHIGDIRDIAILIPKSELNNLRYGAM